MFKTLLIVSAIVSISALASAQNRSVYTSLVTKCKTTSVNKGMAGNATSRCPGIAGYKLDVYLDDERNSLGVVFPSGKVIGLDFWNYFGNFSELGENAEWRMKGKKPVALIIRLKVSDQGDGKPGTSYLIVSKITNSRACVTDIIKPGEKQNLRAKALSDKASTKPCKNSDHD